MHDHEQAFIRGGDFVSRWFGRLSERMATVLARCTDDELGLAPRGGRPGGYRPALRANLAAWQLRMNAMLLQSFSLL